jgi:hypothetical protein
MTTFAELVDETIGMFSAFTGMVEQTCALSIAASPSDLSVVLTDQTMAGRGLYQIEDELVLTTQGDGLSGTMTIPPFGRGQQGTVAAAHAAGVQVTRAPRLPRKRVMQMLNQGITTLYPDLFAVKSDETNSVSVTKWGYGVPADVEQVLDVQYRTPPFGNWIGVREWRLDAFADTADFPTGKAISIGRELWVGAPLKITYAARAKQLVNAADDWSATGLPDSCSDLAVLWAAERLVSAEELMRTQTRSVEQSQRGLISPAGAAANASRLMHQQYTERLQVEKRALQAHYGLPRIVRSWT